MTKKRLVAVIAVMCVVCSFCAFAFAEGEGTTTVNLSETMVTAFTKTVNDTLQMLSDILPLALSVLSAGLVIVLGVNWFKKLLKKGS